MSAGGQDFDADTLFAHQLIGGVGYELNPSVGLYAEGRWFQTESGEFDGPGSLRRRVRDLRLARRRTLCLQPGDVTKLKGPAPVPPERTMQ